MSDAVAKAFEFSVRAEKLSWNHHERIARLDPEERQHWLTRVTTFPAGGNPLAYADRHSRFDTMIVRRVKRHPEPKTTGVLIRPETVAKTTVYATVVRIDRAAI